MMYGRVYRVRFQEITLAAAQDLFQITGATGKMCGIRRVKLTIAATTLPTAQGLSTRCSYLPATVTAGTGGASVTPSKVDQGDAAASFTALRNSTTPATTNGTAVVIETGGGHLYSGEDIWFPKPIPIPPSTAFVYELLNTPSGTVVASGLVEVEELG